MAEVKPPNAERIAISQGRGECPLTEMHPGPMKAKARERRRIALR
jgi:hypothetical protein